MDWDVIIVGAGAGGAAAACFLSKQGCRVVVLEKERLPRYKACAGGVPPGAQRLLPFDLSPVTEAVVTDVIYALRREKRHEQPLYGEAMLMVNRADFDHYVLRQADVEIVEGAEVTALEETGGRVRVRTQEGKTYAARYLIGADGANSRVARALGLRRGRQLGLALEAEVTPGEEVMARYRNRALFLFGALRKGYIWIFPKRHHLSVGIGSFGKTKEDLSAILRREMAALDISLEGVCETAHPLPIHLYAEPLQRGRCLLVGDAAGLVDAFLGEGIRHAVHSARLAADAILNDDVAGYSAAVKAEISAGLAPARWAARFFYGYADLAYWCVERNPELTRLFLRLVSGELSYGALVRRLPFLFVQSVLRRPA